MGVLACLVGKLLASRSSPPELGLSSPRLAKARKVRDGQDPPIERHKAYQHEMVVSGVWGAPSSATTVATLTDPAARTFCWYSPPDERWEMCSERLRAFARVLTCWPGCPEVIIQGGKGDMKDKEVYEDVQRRAVAFYVETFVARFSRLPIAPIAAS